MKPFRLAFIGCGGVANGHVGRIEKIAEAEIVALCDTSAESIKRMKERHPSVADLPVYEDWRKMLDEVKVDAVEIHTPHTLHFEQIMESLARGLHVLTEKPMVCSTEHALAIVKKLEETGLKLQVSYQRHFEPTYRYIHDFIAAGKLGDVIFVSALQGQEWKRATKGAWRQVPELSGGGQLNDSGSHMMDILLWATGLRAESVMAIVDNCGTQVDINTSLAVKFTNGAQASIAVVGDAIHFYEDFTVWGTKGTVFYRNGKLSLSGEDGKLYEPKELPAASDPDRNFIDALLGKAELEVPVECGLRVIELTEAAWRSGKSGCAEKVVRAD